MKFHPDRYPLIVQIVDTHIRPSLLIYSPDFDFRISESYDPNLPGQTEILINRMRIELGKKMELKIHLNQKIPPPTLPNGYSSVLGESLLSMSEAAKLLRISRQTLWRMAHDGKIPSKLTPGGHRRFFRSDVEGVLLQRVETEATTE